MGHMNYVLEVCLGEVCLQDCLENFGFTDVVRMKTEYHDNRYSRYLRHETYVKQIYSESRINHMVSFMNIFV